MLKRLIVGLVLGTVVGAVVAAVLVQGIGMVAFGNAAFAYLAAAATGVLTGLVAGKPIWSADGRIEAGLKAFFGALLALGGMFVLRQWVHVSLDLAPLKAGSGSVGELPAVALPVIAAVLAGFFELDNTPEKDDGKKEGDAGRSKGPSVASKKVRVADADESDEEEEDEPAQAKRKGR
jgi:hypothetical protein